MDNQQPSPKRACTQCGSVKSLEEFPVYGHGRRRHLCKDCFNAYHKRWREGDVRPPADPSRRTCKVCGQTKPVDQFKKVYAKNSRGANYFGRTCADCERIRHAEQMRKYRHQDIDAYRTYRKDYREKNIVVARAQRRESGQRLRDEVYAAYGGYRCVCCGETEPSMLTLDHINEDGAEHRRMLSGGKSSRVPVDIYRRLRDAGFPPDIQVLCYNCNISKHRNGGVCAHKLGEGSETRAQARRPEAIAGRSAGHPDKG